MMRYLSVCSGIEAASVAWEPLGWEAVAFAEIEKFPRAVLKHYYPNIPNLGDMKKFKEWPDAANDVLVGGTPCQSFSVAGLRKGLDDPRGNLALVYLAIVDRYRPHWVVWENVPGVLSSSEGRDFGSFLGGLVQLGYGWAYRVLDAQYFGLAQRRRRVFVVGYLGDWRRAAAVLFEREGLSGNTAPCREAGQGFTHSVAPCLDASGCGFQRTGDNRGQDPVIACAVNAKGGTGRIDAESETFVTGTLNANGKAAGSATQQDAEAGLLVTHSLRADGFDASEDGTGRGTPLVPIPLQEVGARESKKQNGAGIGIGKGGDVMYTLQAGQQYGVATAFTHEETPKFSRDCEQSLDAQNGRRMSVHVGMAVRRLTPCECERLQGFPDNYTLIPFNGKPASDGPRYKALGNSMAVPCMRWIGQRIDMVSAL